jgi:hypothetical protein
MSSVYVVQEVICSGTVYVLVPYGALPEEGGLDFSGTSDLGEISLGTAISGKTRALIKTSGFTGLEPLLGIVRWGFNSTGEGGAEIFIEKGWDFLKGNGKVIDYSDIPVGRSLDVRVRWKRSGVNWSIVYS